MCYHMATGLSGNSGKLDISVGIGLDKLLKFMYAFDSRIL